MKKFLEDRRSVREFDKKKVDQKIIDRIKHDIVFMEEEEGSSDIKFRLYEHGEFVYNNLKDKAGYAGVMIESPHYIALVRKDNEDLTIISGAYHIEKLITRLNAHGLGACWISVNEVDKNTKEETFGEVDGDIDFILAIGYEKGKRPFQ